MTAPVPVIVTWVSTSCPLMFGATVGFVPTLCGVVQDAVEVYKELVADDPQDKDPTNETGILHEAGSISMARFKGSKPAMAEKLPGGASLTMPTASRVARSKTSRTSELFPDPLTPVIAVKRWSGKRTSMS